MSYAEHSVCIASYWGTMRFADAAIGEGGLASAANFEFELKTRPGRTAGAAMPLGARERARAGAHRGLLNLLGVSLIVLGLRLLGLGLIVLAAVLQELRARTAITRAAVQAERERVARDLHDGLAQDLAFIVVCGERMAPGMDAEHPVVIAAKRALQTSRRTIAELSEPADATLRGELEVRDDGRDSVPTRRRRLRERLGLRRDRAHLCSQGASSEVRLSRIGETGFEGARR